MQQTNNQDQYHSSGPMGVDPMETYPEITYLPMPIEKRPTPDFIKYCLRCQYMRLLQLDPALRPFAGVDNPLPWALSNADWFRPRCEEHQKKKKKKNGEGDSRKRKRERHEDSWAAGDARWTASEKKKKRKLTQQWSMKMNEHLLLRTDKTTIYPTSVLYACPYMDVLRNKYNQTMKYSVSVSVYFLMTKRMTFDLTTHKWPWPYYIIIINNQ